MRIKTITNMSMKRNTTNLGEAVASLRVLSLSEARTQARPMLTEEDIMATLDKRYYTLAQTK